MPAPSSARTLKKQAERAGNFAPHPGDLGKAHRHNEVSKEARQLGLAPDHAEMFQRDRLSPPLTSAPASTLARQMESSSSAGVEQPAGCRAALGLDRNSTEKPISFRTENCGHPSLEFPVRRSALPPPFLLRLARPPWRRSPAARRRAGARCSTSTRRATTRPTRRALRQLQQGHRVSASTASMRDGAGHPGAPEERRLGQPGRRDPAGRAPHALCAPSADSGPFQPLQAGQSARAARTPRHCRCGADAGPVVREWLGFPTRGRDAPSSVRKDDRQHPQSGTGDPQNSAVQGMRRRPTPTRVRRAVAHGNGVRRHRDPVLTGSRRRLQPVGARAAVATSDREAKAGPPWRLPPVARHGRPTWRARSARWCGDIPTRPRRASRKAGGGRGGCRRGRIDGRRRSSQWHPPK